MARFAPILLLAAAAACPSPSERPMIAIRKLRSELSARLSRIEQRLGILAPQKVVTQDWRDYYTFRVLGRWGVLDQVTDESRARTPATSGRRVSIRGAFLFFRNVPGTKPGEHLVIGARLEGALPGNGTVATVGTPATVGSDNTVEFTGFPMVGPFPLRPEPLHLTLYLRPAAGDELENLQGRLAGAAGLLRHIVPARSFAVATARSLFMSMIEASRARKWRFALELPGRLRPGQYVFVARPPRDAPADLRRRVNLRALTSRVRLKSRRLRWRRKGEEYTETPYVVLQVIGH